MKLFPQSFCDLLMWGRDRSCSSIRRACVRGGARTCCLLVIGVWVGCLVSSHLLGVDIPLAPASTYPSRGDYDRVHAAVETNDIGAAIALIDRRLQAEDATPFRPRLLVEKAKFLYADQQHIQAQETFLAALAACEPAKTPPSEDEQRRFLSLLPTYEASMDSPEALAQLLEQSEAALRSHPSYLSFEHYRAAALANSGKFIEFFDSFYRAYQARPECFLRYKTMGVLHMRLFESSSDQSCRERHRGNAVAALKQAWALQPQDGPLIVKLAFMLPPDERGAFLRTVVDGVKALRSPLARGECFFLIQQAIDVGELSVAEQLIEQAHSWYHYSRALQGLSEQLVQEQLKQ